MGINSQVTTATTSTVAVTAVTQILAWPVLVTLAAGAGTLYLIWYLLGYREKPGAPWFILTLLGQALFCFSYGFGLAVFDPTLRYWLEIAAFVGLSWLGVPFLGFALGYTGRGTLLQSWLFRGLLAFPAAATLLLPLNRWHNLFLTGFEVESTAGVATATYTLQPIAFFGVLGAAVVVGVGAVLLFDTVLSYGPLYRGEALAVALSPVPPIAGLLPWLFGFGPVPQLNTVALGLLPHVLLDAYAFVGSGMFEFYPATNRAAEQSTIEDLGSPVVVLEDGGRIVDLNDAAERLLGLDRQTVVKQPVAGVLDGRIQPDEFDGSGDSRQLSVRHEGRNLEFLVESSPLTDSSGNHVGYTLLFQDITETVQREERLSVLNRVLRHNLRNDLGVVQLYIDEAQRRSDDTAVEEPLGRAQTKVEELTRAGETAREIEATVGTTMTVTARDPADLLASLASSFEATYPEASIATHCSVDSIETDWAVLESVLEELVENAIVHADSESPAVTVEVTHCGDDVAFTVTDTGPGIPDHEVASLQSGRESALEHGSGLGLWLVKWGVMRLGGELAFDTTSGTAVTVILPADA